MAQTELKAEATEATVSALASKLTYGGGTAAVIGGLTANEIAAFGGLIIAAIGLAVQWFYKVKEDRRKAEQHRKFMESMTLPSGLEE